MQKKNLAMIFDCMQARAVKGTEGFRQARDEAEKIPVEHLEKFAMGEYKEQFDIAERYGVRFLNSWLNRNVLEKETRKNG